MPNYIEQYNQIFNNPDFRKQVIVAAALTAQDVLNEDSTADNHAARVAWAQTVLRNPHNFANDNNLLVIRLHQSIKSADAPSDAQIKDAISALLDSALIQKP